MYVLFALCALAASVLIGLLLKQLWDQHEDRTIQEKWRARERLLDGPATPPALRHEIPVEPEPFARVLFIVARDQRQLVGFLRKDFAAEEAEGVIEILVDRRQSPQGPGAPPRDTDSRRDPHRNRVISTNLREIGWALASAGGSATVSAARRSARGSR